METEQRNPSEHSVEIDELMERIRLAANRQNGLVSGSVREISSTSDLPSVPDPCSPPPSLIGTTRSDAPVRPEVLLDEAESMLRGGRKKNLVPESVPKLLRPFVRNQGGVNGVLLEAVERLIELNRNLRQQNYELNERMMDLHTWMHAVTQASVENRDWMLVADARLRSLAAKNPVKNPEPPPGHAGTDAA